ncbi:MAG TPA: hypothetical protein VK077_00360 [Virgibacillus sp.]|nr:hypothetical protein [Virgibacillus sp.]
MTSCQREIRSCWHFFSVQLPANNKLHQVLPQPYVTYVCLPIVNRSSYVHDRSHPIFDRSFDVADRLDGIIDRLHATVDRLGAFADRS